jgi:signal transduction histidine kinase
VVATLVGVVVSVTTGRSSPDLPWHVAFALVLVIAALVRKRLPDHPLSGWYLVAVGLEPVVLLMDHTLQLAGDAVVNASAMAWLNLAAQLVTLFAMIAGTHLLGLFPDGIVQRRFESWLLRASWSLLAVPVLLLMTTSVVILPWYHDTPAIENPLRIPVVALDAGVGRRVFELVQSFFLVGVVMLFLRYRRSGPAVRQRIRWLLLPALVVVFATLTDLIFDWPPWFVSTLYIAASLTLAVSVAMGLLQPRGIDVDRVLRRSFVYGVLWLAIAGMYGGAAAGLGIAAGQRLSIGWAVTLTVLATLAFQPARARLERLADRWVFGAKADPDKMIARLGATLADTYDLEELLPRMAATLEDGLGLNWARVRLEPTTSNDEHTPAFTVPIVLNDERLGVVECGPRAEGPLTDDEKAVVATFARQAALAVRNVRLTTQLSDQAAELAASRARLVRAEERERRRIERDIHDGVQQDLVALIGQAGHVRRLNSRDADAVAAELASLQSGLERVLGDLRQLAHGIHPSLLRDRGLLAAVEALATRNPVPVLVRADTSLRDMRLAEEVEGAAYYTVAELLANSLKHADAKNVEITLSRSNGSLLIRVSDDGVGFDEMPATGSGFVNLGERLAALGGRLEVTSKPGEGTTVTAVLAVEEWMQRR